MALPADPECDVVIMGAGAAGAAFAARLATGGRRVTVLEAGPPWELSDLVSSQIWSRRLKWGGPAWSVGGADRVGQRFGTGWGLGGSALHHYASWPRLREADFRLASEHGRGLDWPFAYDELRPWYDRVQAEAGVSGDAAAEEGRPPGAPYPLPPLASTPQSDTVVRGFVGMGMRVSPGPMAVLSAEYDNRPPCQYDGWCDAGCPIQALWNPLVRHLPRAREAGATIHARAAVTRIAQDERGRAIGLIYRDKRGEERLQPARTVVLAGAAVENARLLLASASARHGQGFGNGQGLVGRYFTVHAIADSYGLFADATEPHRGLSAPTRMSFSDYGKVKSGTVFGSVSWGLGPAVKPNDLVGLAMTRPDLFGPALHNFMKRASGSLGVVNAICEGLPVAENRVELATERDRNGVPLARVIHTLAPESRALWAWAHAKGPALLRAAGAREAWANPVTMLAHVSGGTVMGAVPARSVCDPLGRLHEAQNVVVGGAGLFPSIGAASPTFTVLALAERTAAAMLARPGEFAA